MTPQKTNVLVLDDEPDIRSEINEFLQTKNVQVHAAALPSEAFKILQTNKVDIAILDVRLPEMNGLDVLTKIRLRFPDVQSIIISGHGDMDAVIRALRLGAIDFFQKPFQLHDMYASIEKTLKHTSEKHKFNGDHFGYTLQKVFNKDSSSSMIIAGKSMTDIADKMRLVARSADTTVLITGESGTGKELIARGIHYLSVRKDKPFLAVNCSTIPDELFESEIFGFTKGAFTGAVIDKPGWFEAAEGGTLFLDEIGDLKPGLQSKLLRVMEDKQICRLGSTSSRMIDVRVIAATNQDLLHLIEEKHFRHDLYHRINTFVIDLPPLRDRAESIPLLLKHYLEYYSNKMQRQVPAIKEEVMAALLDYDYPGNVRELKHMLERALILCESDHLTFDHFEHLKLKISRPRQEITSHNHAGSLDDIEKTSIELALKEAKYNKSLAARMLGISRQALDRKKIRLGIVVK